MIRFSLIAMCLVLCPSVATGQAPADAPAPGAMLPAEAAVVAEGWTALARGDLAAASSTAAQMIRDYPRSPASLALAVEVGVASQGWRGGLDAYDQWVSGRPVENFYALRRVARALLYDALVSSANVRLRVDVADALAREGDPDLAVWLQRVSELQPAGTPRDTATLAVMGDSAAVAALAAAVRNDPRPINALVALGRTRNPAAVGPVTQMLGHARAEVRAAAATALGDLDARESVSDLRRLLKDEQLLPRMAAVGSLLRLGDSTAVAQAYEWFRSDVGDIKLRAAEFTSSNPDATWTAHVRQLLQDPDPMVRIGAARLIGRHDPGAAMWALQPLANDENLAIREEAQRVLPEAIGGDFAQLRRYMRAADADTRVRAALRIVELTR